MQKKRARERIIMFLCIISLLFTPVWLHRNLMQ